jgi:hypothetical protein
METSNSGREHQKKEAQRMLFQFDKELEGHCETVENDVFDHKTRNATLQNGEFSPPSGTLFEAIFLELKRKEQQEKNRHSFSSIISRLHARNRSK